MTPRRRNSAQTDAGQPRPDPPPAYPPPSDDEAADTRGRGSNGRFTNGNQFARGTTRASHAARLRMYLLEELSEEVMREISLALIQKAKKGHLPSIELLFNRSMGRVTNLEDKNDLVDPDDRPLSSEDNFKEVMKMLGIDPDTRESKEIVAKRKTVFELGLGI